MICTCRAYGKVIFLTATRAACAAARKASQDLIDAPRAFSGRSTTAPDLMEFHHTFAARASVTAVREDHFLRTGGEKMHKERVGKDNPTSNNTSYNRVSDT